MSFLDGLNLYANCFKYYYGFDRSSTFVRGILGQNFKFPYLLEEKDLLKIDKVSSVITYFAVFFAVILFLMYLYIIFFPSYIDWFQKRILFLLLVLALPAILSIVLPFVTANFIFNKYLKKYGNYSVEKGNFKTPANSGEKTIPGYERIKRRVVKESSYGIIFVLIFVLFLSYWNNASSVAASLIEHGNYKAAVNILNVRLKLFPIVSSDYGLRAYAKYGLKDYDGAVEDYKTANKYAFSDVYDNDIYAVMSESYNKQQMLDMFKKSYDSKKEQVDKYSVVFARANYLMSIKDYKSANRDYDILVKAYNNEEHLIFPPEILFYRRAITNAKLGNNQGYKNDFSIANKMCPECDFKNVTEEQLKPVPEFDY